MEDWQIKSEENKKKGFIKLHRSLLDWEWYEDINVKILFLHCLLRANYEDRQWRGRIIKRGQFVTSQPKLAHSLKLSIMKIRNSLNKLKLTGEITVNTTAEYSIITVNNYNQYQEDNSLNNTQITQDKQASNSLITTNKEVINKTTNSSRTKNAENTQNKIFIKPTLEEIQKYIDEKNLNVDGEKFLAYYEANGWKVGKNPMKNWKYSLIYWNKNEKKDDESADFLERVERAFKD